MLILKRRRGIKIRIGPDVTVTILETSAHWAKLAIDAPPGWKIDHANSASAETGEKSCATNQRADLAL